DLGAAAHGRHPHGPRLHPRAGVGGALRLHARGRPTGRAGLGWLRRDHGRDRARGAGGGGDARSARPPAEARMTVILLSLAAAVRTLLVLGALAVVCGGITLASERDRPDHVRAVALLAAVGAMTFFAIRDDIIRALHAHANPEAAAAATFVGGVLVTLLWARRLPTRGELGRLAPA